MTELDARAHLAALRFETKRTRAVITLWAMRIVSTITLATVVALWLLFLLWLRPAYLARVDAAPATMSEIWTVTSTAAPCATDLECACQFPDDATPGETDYAQGAREAVKAGLLTCPTPKGAR